MTMFRVINLEYNQTIYQCPTEEDGYYCDLQDPCDNCSLFKEKEDK